MSIVVTGATGQLGRLAVEALLRRGVAPQDVLATGRDGSRLADLDALGVRTAVADYTDAVAVRTAFEGADTVLLVSGSEVGQRVPQHTTVVDAAVEAGVGLLAYTSLANVETAQMALAAEHLATEQVIRRAGIPFTFLRNSWYLENYLGQIPGYLEHGAVVGAAGSGRISAATRADYADAAAAALLADDSAGRAYELGGAPFTLAQLAETVTRASGREVSYHDVPADELTGILVAAGLPRPYAEVLTSADLGIARGELEVTSGDLQRLIGRLPTTLEDAVTSALQGAAVSRLGH